MTDYTKIFTPTNDPAIPSSLPLKLTFQLISSYCFLFFTFPLSHLIAASASASREVSEDMEGFLKQATQKGFIRKTSALEPFGDFENIAVEEKEKDKEKEREVLSRQGSAQDVVKGIFLSGAVF